MVLAPNDYVGNTVVNAGTVRLGDGVTGGSFGKAGDLINGGTVIYNRPSNVVVNRKLSGSGLYAQEGPGGMELANATNDFTGDFEIRAGLVRVTAADAQPSASLRAETT